MTMLSSNSFSPCGINSRIVGSPMVDICNSRKFSPVRGRLRKFTELPLDSLSSFMTSSTSN